MAYVNPQLQLETSVFLSVVKTCIHVDRNIQGVEEPDNIINQHDLISIYKTH